MKREWEEALEAVWLGWESGDHTQGRARDICHVELTEELMQELEAAGLIDIDEKDVFLTKKGREEARKIVRRHRLAEALVRYTLNLSLDEVEEMGCKMEHYLIPEVEESICILLGHPSHCPHGLPIPPGECCRESKDVVSKTVTNLRSLKSGEKGKIAYIKPKNHSRLHRLSSFGVNPGVVVEVHQTYPALLIRFENTELAMDNEIAEDIYVWRL